MKTRISCVPLCCALFALAPFLPALDARAQGVPPSDYGNRQSPIDIIDTTTDPIPPTSARFGATDELNKPWNFNLINTTGGSWCPSCSGAVDQRWGALKAEAQGKLHIVFDNVVYALKEFHFHTPAEHLVNGNLVAMEVHFVFVRDQGSNCDAGKFLVIGQRIGVGQTNPELDKIFGKGVVLPRNYRDQSTPLRGFVPGNVLRGLDRFYLYSGGLTAPANLGCSFPPGNPDQQLASGYLPEVVTWVLLEPTIEVSPEQLARLRALFPNGDARAPQPIRGQKVSKSFPPR